MGFESSYCWGVREISSLKSSAYPTFCVSGLGTYVLCTCAEPLGDDCFFSLRTWGHVLCAMMGLVGQDPAEFLLGLMSPGCRPPCSGVRGLRWQRPHVVDGLEKPPLFSFLSSLPSPQPFPPVTLFMPSCFAWGQV